MTKNQIKAKVEERIKAGTLYSKAELTREYMKLYYKDSASDCSKKHIRKKRQNPHNKIAFIDFEFGQIYGSYRRDFLVTQAAVLLYDTKSQKLQLGEVIFNPDMELVLRGKYKNIHGKYKSFTKVVNLHKKELYKYNKNFKISTTNKKSLRRKWNNQYIAKLKNFLNHALKNIENIYLFGGSEDINILNRYNIKVGNIIDIQTLLYQKDKKQYSLELQQKLPIQKNVRHSLDFFINKLGFDDSVSGDRIKFSKYDYKLPNTNQYFTYQTENLKAHFASGDCIRLFSVYKELIEGFDKI